MLLDVLLEGLALVITDGLAAAAPTLRQAARAFAGGDVPVEERLRWGWLAQAAAVELWDEDILSAITVPTNSSGACGRRALSSCRST